MHQFDIAFEGVQSLRNVEMAKELGPISTEHTKNMRGLKSKLQVYKIFMKLTMDIFIISQ